LVVKRVGSFSAPHYLTASLFPPSFDRKLNRGALGGPPL
jgi:hypothetical protein